MPSRTEHWFQKYYFSRPDYLSGTTEFHQMAQAALPGGSRSRILEIGAGPTNATSAFLANLGELTGVDISEEVRTNTHLRRAVVYDGTKLPFADSEFDLCVSDYVLEHVEDPESHFREVARVLRSSGRYGFRTPNLWHYVALASNLLPHSMHLKLANRLRGAGADAHDPYPTYYRSNSVRAIRRLCKKAGLREVELRMVEKEPSYGRRAAVLFFPMMAYERIVNSTDLLMNFRANIFGVVER